MVNSDPIDLCRILLIHRLSTKLSHQNKCPSNDIQLRKLKPYNGRHHAIRVSAVGFGVHRLWGGGTLRCPGIAREAGFRQHVVSGNAIQVIVEAVSKRAGRTPENFIPERSGDFRKPSLQVHVSELSSRNKSSCHLRQ